MSYQINSAKDNRGDEQLYMELFNRLRPQIEQYKGSHGGDLESAFQGVTGQAWPSGRSVKISHGMPEMTKDRTVKSVLGKYVALPAALAATAVFAPGALPAVGHALAGGAMQGGVGALTGRAAVGAVPSLIQGDWKGAAAGAAGGAFSPGLAGVGGKGGSVMTSMLGKAGVGALQGGIQGGAKGVATGAAGGATSAIPGNVGKFLNMTGQSNVGGDIMSSIMNRGPNEAFKPQTSAQPTFNTPGQRPLGW